jgi:hypothetical protein
LVDLAAFDSCDTLLADFKKAAVRRLDNYPVPVQKGDVDFKSDDDSAKGGVRADAPAAPNPAAAPTSGAGAAESVPAFSGTNVQEKNVDEPDLVKTDGRRIVTVGQGNLQVVDAASRKVTGTLRVPGGRSDANLFLSGDRALLVKPEQTYGAADRPDEQFAPGEPSPYGSGRSRSQIMLIDLAGAPKVLGEMTVDGGYVDARMVGSMARIVVKSQPRGPEPISRTRDKDDRERKSKESIARTKIDDWLPSYELSVDGEKTKGSLLDCDRVSHPSLEAGSDGYSGRNITSLLSLDLTKPLGPGDGVALAADTDTVYASATSMYLAAKYAPDRWQQPRTAIYRFDVGGTGTPRHTATGDVEGALLNQYSMSEYAGHLRVATTTQGSLGSFPGSATASPMPPGAPRMMPTVPNTESSVTVLEARGADLAQVGRVGGLGRGEKIYAVRFTGPIGYVVTFRQTDPLYTLDLRDPRSPRTVGELKINGYSAYLHPVGDGTKVIGVGQDATDAGRRLGTQVSVFDTGDLRDPQRVAQFAAGSGSSEVEADPHAFLYWEKDGTLVVPVRASGVSYALVLRLQGTQLVHVGEVRHPESAAVRRSLVIGEDLWTVSAKGMMVAPLSSPTSGTWVQFA